MSAESIETPSKKLKMNEPDDWFAKVPDEILEMIIRHVPSKHSCFLVSKRFHRATIRVTRGKCLVNLTRENLECPGFMNIQFEFDEIRLANLNPRLIMMKYGFRDDLERMNNSFASKILEFIEKFGFRIKKFLLYSLYIDKSDLLKLLRLMPNLIELHFVDCYVLDGSLQFLQCTPEPVGVLELKLLKKLVTCKDCWIFELLDSISCPSLVTYWNDAIICDPPHFPQMHSHTLKDVEFVMDPETQTEIFQELHQCHLERISIDVEESALASTATSTQIVQLIESQLIESQLKSLEIGQLQISTPELLRSISNLKRLESLGMRISTDTIYPRSLVREIMQLPKLKSLSIEVNNDEFIESMLSVRNEQLQSLSFKSEKDVGISRIGDNFPNLKHLALHGDQKVNIQFINRLKKLESLSLSGTGISLEDSDELEVNESVRFLRYEPKLEHDSVGSKLVQAMPNISNIETFSRVSFGPQAPIQLLDQILSLQNLVEIQCKAEYLLKAEVIACIKNRPQSSRLQRITFHLVGYISNEQKRRSESIVENYRNQFPIKRMKYKYNGIIQVTLSRF